MRWIQFPGPPLLVSYPSRRLELLGKHFGVAQEDTETKMHEEIALALDQGRERCYRLGLMSRPGTNGDDAPESG